MSWLRRRPRPPAPPPPVRVAVASHQPEAEMLAAMLGTTGNLRAPTVVRGKTVLVGFNEEAFEQNLLG